jgi:hypothetical protein
MQTRDWVRCDTVFKVYECMLQICKVSNTTKKVLAVQKFKVFLVQKDSLTSLWILSLDILFILKFNIIIVYLTYC